MDSSTRKARSRSRQQEQDKPKLQPKETIMPTSQGFRGLRVYQLAKKRLLELRTGYEEVGRMLGGMIAHPERFNR
jgi:hypothetical protein